MAVTGAPSPAERRRRFILGGLVFALAVAVFAPIRSHEWLNYDDNVYVTDSEPVRAGWSGAGLVWAFSSFDGANWFPLTRLSWMLDSEIHGLDAGGFLVTNLLLHALASLILFAALVRLTQRAGRSAFAAALFAAHPLHVESVAWVSARKDPLSAVFWMLALLVYARQRERGTSVGGQVALFACTALGLMAKPIVVTLPFALLLLDAWPLARLRSESEPDRWDPARLRRAVVEKLPLFALVFAASVVTFLAQRSGGTVASLEHIPLSSRLCNAVVSYATYLGKAFWPTHLAVFYPHAGSELELGRVVASAMLLIAISIAVWRLRRSRPYLAVGWLWYLGTLVPVIGIVQVGSQAMADRYTYIPLIGIGIAVSWGVHDLCAKLPARRLVLPAAACAAIAGLAAASSLQVRHWRDSVALFRHALTATRDNHVAHAYLGTALLERGDTGAAIEQYQAALRLRPEYLKVANNLAWLLATTGEARLRDPESAVRLAKRAARATRMQDPAVLDTLAAAYASAGRFRQARRTGRRALAIAEQGDDAELASEIAQRLAGYRADRAYVESAP